MSTNLNIPIQNIYYMLSYAFQTLQTEGYRILGDEKFHTGNDLFAEILIKGISAQIKRGLVREYTSTADALFSIKGKIEFGETIKTNSLLRKKLVCSHDEFSVNSRINQILKTTIFYLLKADISKERKKKLKDLALFFGDVVALDPYDISWDVRYTRENQTYRMLIYICYLVLNHFLQSTTSESRKVIDFSDKEMHKLYEKFILEYYKRHYSDINTNASQVNWQLDPNDDSSMLPTMKTDVTMMQGNKILIIDAKYYTKSTQSNYDTDKMHSGNMYQIFTYVKNKAASEPQKKVAGLLLYAKTASDVLGSGHSYKIMGNEISVQSLDLNCKFSDIEEQLDSIANKHFPKCKKNNFF